MKKLFFRFTLLVILAVGMSWGIYALTSSEVYPYDKQVDQQKHNVSYQLPLGLPKLQFGFYW